MGGPEDRWVRLVRTLLELSATMLMIWYMLPQHERNQVLMRLAQHGQTWTQWTARTTSRWAIRAELAGDVDTAAAGYGMAHRLMTGPYQAAAAWYQSLRSS